MRRPYILASFLIKENGFVRRLNSWSFGVEADSSSLLEFSLISISCMLVEVVLYCFNESLLDYYIVSTISECLGEQSSRSF